MRCSKCGYERDSDGKCPHCENTEAVHVMSREEKDAYHGVTIDADSGREEQAAGKEPFTRKSPRTKIYVSSQSSNWMIKAGLFLLFAALAAFVFFVALPVVVVAAGIGIVVWFLLNFLR